MIRLIVCSQADLAELRHALDGFADLLTQSGVGALPLVRLQPDGSLPPLPEQETLLTRTSNAVAALYARQKQIQENNAVVASLLSAPDGSRK